MQFASDNWAGVSPRVAAAIAAAGQGLAPAYGGDAATAEVEAGLAALFEREVAVFLTPTGTATNALALSALCPPYGLVLAHRQAHVIADEAGAPEFAMQGARFVGLPGRGNKLTPETVRRGLAALPARPEYPPARALTVTQATECGTLYRPDEVAALGALARENGLGLHMDGARFANAVAALGCTPAEITWKAGVDVLSFGLTKNGAFMAEAVVLFDPAGADTVAWRRRRGGHIVSKSRFMAVQFLAMLEGGHWLELAGHANAMAGTLGEGLAAAGHRLAWPVEANEVFAFLPTDLASQAVAAGARFHPWTHTHLEADQQPAPGTGLYRFVASFATTAADVEALLALL